MHKKHEKIYVNNYCTIGIDCVSLVQELNDAQVLIEDNGRFSVVNKGQIVAEEDYNSYIETMYKDDLKKFKEFISYSGTNKANLSRMINELTEEGILND